MPNERHRQRNSSGTKRQISKAVGGDVNGKVK